MVIAFWNQALYSMSTILWKETFSKHIYKIKKLNAIKE